MSEPTIPNRRCRRCGATSGIVMLPYGPLAPREWKCHDGCKPAMSDVDLLREAARQMRELASAVEQGHWGAETNNKGHAWINLPAYQHAWGMHGFVDEAKHVAPFASPAVALAVAAWIDSHATDLASANGDRMQTDSPGDVEQAVKVAKAYLGVPR